MKRLIYTVLLLTVLWLAFPKEVYALVDTSSGASQNVTAEVTEAPTPTPTPTPTPSPTPTEEPTQTVEPTATASPQPTTSPAKDDSSDNTGKIYTYIFLGVFLLILVAIFLAVLIRYIDQQRFGRRD